MTTQKQDLTGKVYGRLTVLSEIVQRGNFGQIRWECRCECGSLRAVDGGSLRRGLSKSCGCLNREITSKAARERETRHGESDTVVYETWRQMRARCNRPTMKSYHLYGGRGIKVCERWSVYENFKADMGERPPGMSIDRIDPNGNYEPGNCRWATDEEQCNNKRQTVYMDMPDGRRIPLAMAARELGINSQTLRGRLKHTTTDFERLLRPIDMRHSPRRWKAAKEAS